MSLLWIAHADGQIDQNELLLIKKMSRESGLEEETEYLISLVKKQKEEDFILLCSFIKNNLPFNSREYFLELLIEISIINCRINISQNYLLRFFCDLLGFPPLRLQSLFRSVAGMELPNLGDPSSIEWWEQYSQTKRTKKEDKKRKKSNSAGGDRTSSNTISQEEAFVILGLTPSATKEDVIKAYRRLAQSHHPDRFVNLGPKAQETAKIMFQRIREAYEVLV